ncbi:MAG: ATP-binding protein [Alphaproteobacteria bacterium]
MTDRILVVETGGRILHVNQAARHVLGVAAEGPVGDFLLGTLLPGVTLPQEGERADFREETLFPHPDGPPTRIEVTGFRAVGEGERDLWVLRLRDCRIPEPSEAVTDGAGRHREAVILEGISQYQSEMICRFLPDTRITYANSAYAEAFGLTVADMVGRRIVEFLPRAGQADLVRYFASFTPGKPERFYEHEMTLANGRRAWTCWSDRAFFDETGKVAEYQSIGRDLSDLREAYVQLQRSEAVLRHARDAAEHANRVKSEFIAHASHEVRTPLNVIIGFSEILKGEMIGAMGNVRYLEYARIIYESGNYLLTLINDVLDLSKIEAGKYGISPARIPLPPILEMVTTLVSHQVERGRLRLTTTLPSFLPDIHADERAVKQVLLNLISNAIKFTPAGGRIAILVEVAGDFVQIQVSDTGIGIPAGDIDRMIQPYERMEGPGVREQPGTGIGLTLTKSLVELHGGSLRLQSEEGVGTVVTVTFPQNPPMPANTEDDAREEVP